MLCFESQIYLLHIVTSQNSKYAWNSCTPTSILQFSSGKNLEKQKQLKTTVNIANQTNNAQNEHKPEFKPAESTPDAAELATAS